MDNKAYQENMDDLWEKHPNYMALLFCILNPGTTVEDGLNMMQVKAWSRTSTDREIKDDDYVRDRRVDFNPNSTMNRNV